MGNDLSIHDRLVEKVREELVSRVITFFGGDREIIYHAMHGPCRTIRLSAAARTLSLRQLRETLGKPLVKAVGDLVGQADLAVLDFAEDEAGDIHLGALAGHEVGEFILENIDLGAEKPPKQHPDPIFKGCLAGDDGVGGNGNVAHT